MFLYGDMDSGGWPKNGRDKSLRIIRKAFAFHICGDQQLPMLAQYGIDARRDANWTFCTPPIASCYERRFLPDKLGFKGSNFSPKVFEEGKYTLKIGIPEEGTWKVFSGIQSISGKTKEELHVILD